MILKRCVHTYMLIGVSSLLSLTALSTAVLATPTVESAPSAKERNADNLSQGLPGRRLGGGTRSDLVFSNAYASLVALTAPGSLSITTALQPKLLFYVPEMKTANTAEFVLFNQNNELVYETIFEVDPTGGLVSIDPTVSMPPLALAENYQWYFSIIPKADDRAHDIVVYGSIRRVQEADWLAQQQIEVSSLNQLTPLMKARMLYQQADLWLDAAMILDRLRRQNPGDAAIAAEWTHLLESAGLALMLQPSQPPAESNNLS